MQLFFFRRFPMAFNNSKNLEIGIHPFILI